MVIILGCFEFLLIKFYKIVKYENMVIDFDIYRELILKVLYNVYFIIVLSDKLLSIIFEYI